MEALDILNVSLIEPRLKHPKIFEKFDSLNEGEHFTIHNDHDPKPLYYQLLGERGEIFTWEYLENGPEIWKVRIAKRKHGENELTIGELVTKDFRKAQVFKKLGIDFCCGGKKTLSEVCGKKGIDIHKVEAELAAVSSEGQATGENFQIWGLDFLSDYVINVHHNYVRESIPFLTEISQKVARVHGDRHPELRKVAEVFAAVAKDLSLHITKEESILFPYIKEMVAAKKAGSSLPVSMFGGVVNPINVMEMEHEGAGEDLSELRSLTNNYELPEDACTSYKILFQKLEEFESDLFQHVHLESNILFPKALELEAELK